MNTSNRKQLETEAGAIATMGGVYTSMNGLLQSQHPSIRSLRYDASSTCNRQTHGVLYVEQMAVYKCKQLGEGKLCNVTHCKRISGSPTLADNRDELEHRYAAKQHLLLSI